VVANETVGGETLRDTIRQRIEGSRAEVLVVSPALNTPLKHWVSDDDQARVAAQQRLEASLARLRESGIEARGEIGDGEPLQAIEDALRTFGADEIIISTHPEGRSNWLEKGVVSAARERFAVPITHVGGRATKSGSGSAGAMTTSSPGKRRLSAAQLVAPGVARRSAKNCSDESASGCAGSMTTHRWENRIYS